MSGCTFCPNEGYTSLWVKDYADGTDPQEHEIRVCIDCLNSFEESKRGVE